MVREGIDDFFEAGRKVFALCESFRMNLARLVGAVQERDHVVGVRGEVRQMVSEGAIFGLRHGKNSLGDSAST
jgi:hypothetical protein